MQYSHSTLKTISCKIQSINGTILLIDNEDGFMKFAVIIILIMLSITDISYAKELTPDDIFDIKQNAFALYNTNHTKEAYELLSDIPDNKKDEEVYLILSNIEMDKNNTDKALSYLKSSIQKNPEYYKAYYNLGCLFMQRRIYTLAIDNFKLAVKYNKENPYCYYNLASAYINTGEYKKAKKNLIKAIYLKNDEKDFYYNLAYVNKKLGKEKDSRKMIDFYNETFTK